MERLENRIERFLRTAEGDFEALALELFSHQYDKNKPYQSFCNALGMAPKAVSHWADIPAVPIDAFKSAELCTFPVERSAAVFHSSGTTRNLPSRHFLRTLTYYETALSSGLEAAMPEIRESLPFLLLAPAPGEAPHSSLSWMLEVLKRKWGAAESAYFMQRGRIDDWSLFRVLTEKQAAGQPVALLGTTLGFLTCFDQCVRQSRPFKCAPGSWLMDTGGMKTVSRDVSREQFLRLVTAYLGIPESQCLNEYGMCELSSQSYARGGSSLFQWPPWVRTLVIDRETGRPAPEGKTGLLRHFDLANVDSVLAIQTADEGIAAPGGFLFKGRARDAELKGCSLDAERYLNEAR